MATDTANSAGANKPEKPKAAPADWFVLDTTARDDYYEGDILRKGERTHEQIVDGQLKRYTFERAKPLGMPSAEAVKFLKSDGFIRTDENGKPIDYKRTPTQPDQLGAGEKFTLADDQTIARYDELALPALVMRAAEFPGGERFAKGEQKPDRDEVVRFIVSTIAATRKANSKSDRAEDEFTPPAELDDAA